MLFRVYFLKYLHRKPTLPLYMQICTAATEHLHVAADSSENGHHLSAREALGDQAAAQHAIRGLHMGAVASGPHPPRYPGMPVTLWA